MTAAVCAWLVVGVAMGIVHAWLLVQATRRPKRFPLILGEARLLLVFVGFGIAVFSGGLMPTSLGWVAGFTTGCCAAWGNLS